MKRTALCFADSSTPNFHPFVSRGLIDDMGHESPMPAPLFGRVDNHSVTVANPIPLARAHDQSAANRDGLLRHISIVT